MDAFKQSLMRAQPTKPPGRGGSSDSGGPNAELDARFSALDQKLDQLIHMLTASGEEPGPPLYLLVSDVRRVLTQHFKITEQEIDRLGRGAKITRVRQIGYYLSRQHTTRSLPDIGRAFGGRDHTTVLYGVRKIGELRKTDTALEADLTKLEAKLAALLARRGGV